jgi:glycosyltransferase involved in cell wall biosynthesis
VNRDSHRLAFVSPTFLFPNDTGGKIRTTNILRGLKGGAFDITLMSPATAEQRRVWSADLGRVCDRFVPWVPRAPLPRWRRSVDLLRRVPVNVAADQSAAARRVVREGLQLGRFDVAVFDFVHAAVLRPVHVDAATVCFTHNVEAEIFQRHAEQSGGLLMRSIWASQYRKMLRFEGDALRRFTQVVAVSERDAARFLAWYGVRHTSVIPTGVDLDHFAWREPPPVGAEAPPTVVFTGSMDWEANVDGIRFFIENVWPTVTRRIADARFVVVGRSPPRSLVELGHAAKNVRFTGFVDDVRPEVHAAHVAVIPLRVGGGTRIKVFEAMAMGCPLVSTAIGVEGLDVDDGVHYLCRDEAQDQAAAIIELLRDAGTRAALSQRARECVERRFSHLEGARAFERACLRALDIAAPLSDGSIPLESVDAMGNEQWAIERGDSVSIAASKNDTSA